MSTVTQKRDVRDFHRVVMQEWGELDITQGAEEALTVEADADMLDRIFSEVKNGELTLRVGRDWMERLQMGLHTSLTRPRIRYSLVVKNLSGLGMSGYGQATADALSTSTLALTLSGAGELKVRSLAAESLQVELSGGGSVTVAGQSRQQSVLLSGVGRYDGGQLQSQAARVDIRGAGSATVWATGNLDVRLSGVGSVEYYGNPVVRKSATGLGSIRSLGGR